MKLFMLVACALTLFITSANASPSPWKCTQSGAGKMPVCSLKSATDK